MIDFRKMRDLMRKEEHMQMAIARERAKAEKITASISQNGGGGSRGTSSRVEDGAVALVILQEEYKLIMDELDQQRNELKQYLHELNDLQRTCMRMRYLKGLSCRRVAEATCYSDFHVYHVIQAAEDQIYKLQDDFRQSKHSNP